MFVGKVKEPVLEGANTRGFIRAGSGFHRKYWTWLEGLSMDICSSLLVLQFVTKKQVFLIVAPDLNCLCFMTNLV
jgi:hypothetical protein